MPNNPESMKAPSPIDCDIFCNVIDNFGDIGVCWRLARQLANEHGRSVRLWVDDLHSFAMLCPEANTESEKQQCRDVEVRVWRKEFPDVQPAGLVIETFACKLPPGYIEAMALQENIPVWINLEHLSAEDWVVGYHKLPSPHPTLPLTKYFFFPGFSSQTGGLLLERDLLAKRDAFQNDPAKQQAFWTFIGMEMPEAGTLKVSLFAYENAALADLFEVWASGDQAVICLIPEGRILPQAGRYFGDDTPRAGRIYARGKLAVSVLPFFEQERYDELLWACDVNFVRGEDSWVRALWAGKPFIWQIYPQHDSAHSKKLEAFLSVYCDQLGDYSSLAIQGLWKSWNVERGAGQTWPAYMAARGELERHTQNWARHLSKNNLALNLLDFSREIGRMRAFEIKGSNHENSTRTSFR